MKSKRFLVALTFLTALFGYQCGRNITVPDELIGKWKTSPLISEGSFFEFTKNSIIFGTIEEDANTYPIMKIKSEKIRKEEWILYTIYYRSEGIHEYEFSFYYHPSNDGVIRFKNKLQSVWKQEER